MKGLLAGIVALVLAGVALSSAAATSTQSAKRGTAICHRTAKGGPYVKLLVSAKALKAHLKHPADIVPAPKGACPKTVLVSGGTVFSVALTGEAESAPGGDPVATGTATFHLRKGQGQVCYQLAVKDVTGVAAHIHQGDAGSGGPVVVPLATPGADGTSAGCATVSRSIVASILADPGSFYANVHSQDFPAGAIRGQLTGTDESSFGTIAHVDIKGSSEPNAKGTAVFRFRKADGLVCFKLHAESITLPAVAAHIHVGAAGTNGGVVVPLKAPDATGNASGCTPTPAATIDAITGNLAGYYVNIHTKEHPAGALRGQLG